MFAPRVGEESAGRAAQIRGQFAAVGEVPHRSGREFRHAARGDRRAGTSGATARLIGEYAGKRAEIPPIGDLACS
jgi:hypothetical protein